jgi:hypothetical protein
VILRSVAKPVKARARRKLFGPGHLHCDSRKGMTRLPPG